MTNKALLAGLAIVGVCIAGFSMANRVSVAKPVIPEEASEQSPSRDSEPLVNELKPVTTTEAREVSGLRVEPALDEPVDIVETDVLEIRGRVVLSDGTPAAGVHLAALHPDALPTSARMLVRAKEESSFLLDDTYSEEDGGFVFRFKHVGELPGSFRIRQLNLWLGQSDRLYLVERSTELNHVIPGGQIIFKVEDAGRVVTVFAQFVRADDNPSREPAWHSHFAGEDHDARFFYPEACTVNVRATRAYDGASATLFDLYLDPTKPNQEQTLVLVPLEVVGRIKISVVDQDGVPVENFAVRVEALDGSLGPRYMYSEELGIDKIFGGMPLGEAKVTLVRRHTAPLSLYSDRPEPIRYTVVHGDRLAEVEFRVEAQTYLAFDLVRDSTNAPKLKVRYRYDYDELGVWQKDGMWRFLEEGGTIWGISMEANDRYYSETMKGGLVWYEVYSSETNETVWEGTALLVPGQLAPIELR